MTQQTLKILDITYAVASDIATGQYIITEQAGLIDMPQEPLEVLDVHAAIAGDIALGEIWASRVTFSVPTSISYSRAT